MWMHEAGLVQVLLLFALNCWRIDVALQGTVFRAKLGDFLGSGIFMSDGDTWRRHRKIASTEFSTRKLREHSNTVFREDAIRLVNTLNLAMAANKPVEFQVHKLPTFKRNLNACLINYLMHLHDVHCGTELGSADDVRQHLQSGVRSGHGQSLAQSA
jgi:hypothetical protein